MAMSRPSDDTSLAVVDAVGMWRNRNRSRARPMAGRHHQHRQDEGDPHREVAALTSRSKMKAATKAWAPKARLNTPVARNVSTRPTAMRA